MHYALYRKWRPRNFDDVISQSAITTTLVNEVKSGNVSHAYLFTGTRGTGKTTCAKILSVAVNCENSQNGEPCLECKICTGINDGSILDVIEIDAASNNGVDDIRNLREEANFTPIICKYRVYIIDEVHMLSTSAFNAFLKIMEEPPSHVIFILATTEAHKIPATIISRCQRFDFRPISLADIAKRLLYIAENEKIKLDNDAAELIAKLAQGAMRDAISILDQCLAFSPHVDLQTVINVCGITDSECLFAISDAILKNDVATGLAHIDNAYRAAKDFDRLCVELLSHFRNLMLAKTTKNKELIICLPDEYQQIKNFAEKFSVQDIIHCIEVLETTLDKLARSPQKRLVMEVCVVKLCTPAASFSQDALLRRIEKLENGIATGNITVENIPSVNIQPKIKPRIITEHEDIQEDEPPPFGDNDVPFEPDNLQSISEKKRQETEPIAPQPLQEPTVPKSPQEPIAQQATQEPIVQQATQEPIITQSIQEPIAQQATQETIAQQAIQEPITQQATQESTSSQAIPKKTKNRKQSDFAKTKNLDMKKLAKYLDIGLASFVPEMTVEIKENEIELTSANMILPSLLKIVENRDMIISAIKMQTGDGYTVLFNDEMLGSTSNANGDAVVKTKSGETSTEKNTKEENTISDNQDKKNIINDNQDELSKLADNMKNLDIEVNIE